MGCFKDAKMVEYGSSSGTDTTLPQSYRCHGFKKTLFIKKT
jgi:hypothetical protein